MPFPDLKLLPEGAVYLTDSSTLIVADVHLGKSAAFRARGVPVPEGDTARDLARLMALAKSHQAAHLVIAGDLFHAPSGITPELKSALNVFLEAIEVPVTLVLGNHDVNLRGIPAMLNPVVHLDFDPVYRVIHDPSHANSDRIHLSGHWHPVVRIPDGKRTTLRLPCFLYRDNTLVMPAFGSFTGGAVMRPQTGDRFFVALREQVVELPNEAHIRR